MRGCMVLVCLVGCLLGAAMADDGRPAEGIDARAPIRFDAGRFVLSDATVPPGAEAAWAPVELTDLWRQSRPGVGGHGWYRFAFELEAPAGERWSVYLPGLASNAAVFVNGERVGDGGRMTPPVTLNSNRPLFFTISPRLLRAGENRVDVRLFAHVDSWDRLEPLWVGPASALAPRYERQHFWHMDVARFSTGLIVVMLLLIGAIFVGSGWEPVYGWFLATASFWSIVSFNYHIAELPIPFHSWERLVHLSMAAAACSAMVLALRLVAIEHRRTERALLVGLAVAGAGLALTPVGSIQDAVRVVDVAAMGTLVAVMVTVGRHRRLLQQAELPIFLAGAIGFVVIAAHDLAIQLEWLPMDRPRLLPLGGLLILATFAGCLTARFMRTSQRVSRINVELAERVAESERELAESYGRMSELEKERALSRERARILREVHDGMGGKIVSSLALLETGRAPSERIAETLRDSLDDKGLLMHSLHPDAGDLDALLGLLRDRLDARLRGSGVELEWRPGDLQRDVPLSPEQCHNVGRIVEEAFTNVLKHARAGCIRVSTEVAERGGRDHVLLTVSDDGRAGSAAPSEGHGLRNMRARAAALGGRLDVEHAEQGTNVRLWIPIDGRAPLR